MKPVFPAHARIDRGALVLDGVNVANLSAMLRAHGPHVRVTLEFVDEPTPLPVRAVCGFCNRAHYPQDCCQE